MKSFSCVLALVVWGASVTAAADAEKSLSDIRKLLTVNSMVCGDFTQSKSLRALTRPLVSRGRLVFVAGKGVLWQVTEPFATQVLVKSDALIKWDDNGVPHQVNFGQTPIFHALSQVFLAAFAGDIDRLQEPFKLQTNSNQSNWQLTLTPRDPNFSAIITSIKVSGDRFVNEILIAEERGDNTHIRFSGVTADSCQLGDAEKGYFAH